MVDKKKSYIDWLWARLRDLEIVTSYMNDVSKMLNPACDNRDRARKKFSATRQLDPPPSVGHKLSEYLRRQKAEERVHRLFNARDYLDYRRAVLSDEVTRAVIVNALRGICRSVLGEACPSGRKIAEMVHRRGGLAETITLTNCLRNIDLAREAKLWKTRSGGMSPPRINEHEIQMILDGLWNPRHSGGRIVKN